MVRLRLMTADDMPFGMRLKEQAGWNQTEGDWRRFLRMQPEGCLLAELDGFPVGTSVVTAFGSVAWISMVLVDERYRGRGVGMALLARALSIAEEFRCRSVRLDATSLGRPLYERLGFGRQYELIRFEGVVLEAAAAAAPENLREATAADLAPILDLDRRGTGTSREAFLQELFRDHGSAWRVCVENGTILGYLATRAGSNAVQLGPCIAVSPAAGAGLMRDALVRHAGSRVYWDVPADHSAAVQLAQQAGLSPQRQFVRMCRGEPVDDDREMLWASSGPELG